jgi:hypothetical protein
VSIEYDDGESCYERGTGERNRFADAPEDERHARCVLCLGRVSVRIDYRRGRSRDMKRMNSRRQSGRIDLVEETMLSGIECFEMCSLGYSSISTDCCS